MMTSSRAPFDVGSTYASRRGHANKLSISDPSHHVTEAIGTLYGDEPEYPPTFDQRTGRPLSFIASSYPEDFPKGRPNTTLSAPDDPSRPSLARSTSDTAAQPGTNGDSNTPRKAQTLPTRTPSHRTKPFEPASSPPHLSPAMSLKDVETGSQFPLAAMDHPGDIAQELSNLQALRRMSMDVGNNADPDLLPFSTMSLMAMPSVAPTGGDDEGDPSRLLWVPARVHPELAPVEFKSFFEKRVQSIKRRSGESLLSRDGASSPDGSDASGGLRRKKSMLSRQVDPTRLSLDPDERLERASTLSVLSELSIDELVKDPTKAMQKLAQPQDGSVSDAVLEDMPILPVAPGMGLRRSTRTQYRKGGSLRGEKLPFSKRIAAAKQAERDAAAAAAAGGTPASSETSHVTTAIDGVASQPVGNSQTETVTENYSRPTRSVRRQQKFSQDTLPAVGSEAVSNSIHPPDQISVRLPATERPSETSPGQLDSSHPQPGEVDNSHSITTPMTQPLPAFPQRSSSQKTELLDESPAKPSKRAGAAGWPAQNQKQSAQTISDMAQSPAAIPGGGASRTDSLTFIPTYTGDEKKTDKKGKKDRDDESVSSLRTSGWKWFKGGADEKKRKEEEKKTKGKNTVERAQDNARLDVLQTSIENAATKGRESLHQDRESMDNKLQEERKKESSRKSDSKKEKDGNIFSSLFGGSKKKADREGGKKSHNRHISEDKVYRPLKPDIDYPWTRFPLMEERTIYRMAHIKLANPRRSLHSQVLLSNFMYNYLAIVQAMHPQMQIPISPQQKRLEEERRRKEEEQLYLEQQQQQQQQQLQAGGQNNGTDHYDYDYHHGDNQYGDALTSEGAVDYIDDAQIYEYEHSGSVHDDRHDASGHGTGYGAPDEYDQRQKEYYGYDSNNGHVNQHAGDDRGRNNTQSSNMW